MPRITNKPPLAGPFIICFLAFAAACGSQASRYPHGSSDVAHETFGNADQIAATPGSDECKSNQVVAELEWSLGNINSIPASLLTVQQNERETSLCSLLLAADKEVVIFQFAGVLCLSCQEEAEYFSTKLENEAFASRVLHVVVITDFKSDYSESEFQYFMDTYAPKSSRVHDLEIKLWKYFSNDPTQPVRPTIVAMNRNSDAVILNNEGEDHSRIISATEALLDKLDKEKK